MSRVFDDDDCSTFEMWEHVRQHRTETPEEEVAARVVYAKGNRADDLAAAEAEDLAEIEIDGDDRALLCIGFRESAVVKLFAREPGRILDRFTHVVLLEVRVRPQHLFRRRTVRDLPEDRGNRDAHAADAR